jgi:hypothetical protein
VSRLGSYLRQHHVALIALFFALAGTSVAASDKLLPANSVGTRQVIDRSLLARDFKKGLLKGKGPTGPEGPPGIQGVPGNPGVTTNIWAVVDGVNGTIARGSGVTSIGVLGVGEYVLDFIQDVSGCAYVGTLGSVDV